MNELDHRDGRTLAGKPFPPVDNTPGDTILSVQHLSTKYAPYLQDVSFDVKEGEIFGLYGLVAPDVPSFWRLSLVCVPERRAASTLKTA